MMRSGGDVSFVGGWFFHKIAIRHGASQKQMAALDSDPATKRLAYIVVKFDDVLHEYCDAYRLQIDEFMASANPGLELEVIFDIDPAFYAARHRARRA